MLKDFLYAFLMVLLYLIFTCVLPLLTDYFLSKKLKYTSLIFLPNSQGMLMVAILSFIPACLLYVAWLAFQSTAVTLLIMLLSYVLVTLVYLVYGLTNKSKKED